MGTDWETDLWRDLTGKLLGQYLNKYDCNDKITYNWPWDIHQHLQLLSECLPLKMLEQLQKSSAKTIKIEINI